jgi:hypothetical protein
MLKVTENIQNIEKKGHNDYSNYDYVRAVDVISEVQKELVKNKIYLAISEMDHKVSSVAKEKGGFTNYSDITCKATFFNVEKPEEKIEVMYFARASDSGDKDIYKAKTNGLKYLLTQQFMIVTDVLIDAEQDHKTVDTPKKETPKYIKPEPTKVCATCGVPVEDKVVVFSMAKFEKVLCYKCQKSPKKEEKPIKELNPKFTSKEEMPF